MNSISNWIKANTPESAAVAALLTDVAAYLTGALTAHDAVVAAVATIVAFVLAEAHVDASKPSSVP